MRNLELYIEGRKIDLDESTYINLNKQLFDIFNPGTLKNDFTKTVSVPFSNSNNVTFDYLYNPTRVVTSDLSIVNIGRSFNPSKKANFKLIVNGMLIHSGYAKLRNINVTEKRYNIELYGELGNFFSKFDNLTLREVLEAIPAYNNRIETSSTTYVLGMQKHISKGTFNENDIPNRDTDIGEPSTSLHIFDNRYNNLNMQKELTRYLTGVPDFSTQGGDLFADFITTESGLYNDGDKAELYTNENIEQKVTPLNRVYTENELLLKDYTKQRWGLYIDMLIYSMITTKTQYQIEESDFVNLDNPYWNKLMLASPMIQNHDKEPFSVIALRNQINIKTTTTNSTATWYNRIDAPRLPSIPSNNVFTLGSLTSQSFTQSSPAMNFNSYPIRAIGATTERDFTHYKTTLKWLPSLATRFWFPVGSLTTGIGQNYIPAGWSGAYWTLYMGYLGDDGASQTYYWNQFSRNNRIRLVSQDLHNPEVDDYNFRISWNIVWNNWEIQINTNTIASPEWKHLGQFILQFGYKHSIYIDTNTNARITPILFSQQTRNTSAYLTDGGGFVFMNNVTTDCEIPRFEINLESEDRILSKSQLKYFELVPDVPAKEFLLSYLKTFNLVPVIDTITNKISLKTMKEFYDEGQIIDYTYKLAVDKPIEINPLSFNYKYIDLKHKDSDTHLGQRYKGITGRNYGTTRINTGYDFNESTFDLLNKSVFNSYITVGGTQNAFGTDSNPRLVPHLYSSTLNKSTPTDGCYLLFQNGCRSLLNEANVLDGVRTKYNTLVEKWVEPTSFMINNDNFYYPIEWYNLNPIFNGNYVAVSQGPTGIGFTEHYHESTSYYFDENGVVTHSLDFSIPERRYITNQFNENASIYKRYWEDFIVDRYNVNTKILNAYFYLTPSEFYNLNLNDIIFLKDKYWVINKIEDYDLNSTRPVKMELVSINDLTNYQTTP